MKTIARYIQMISWTDEQGNINPIRFKLTNDDGSCSVIRVDRVLFKEKEKLAGNPMLIYRCQSVISGIERIFELKYELGTCKWMLFNI